MNSIWGIELSLPVAILIELAFCVGCHVLGL